MRPRGRPPDWTPYRSGPPPGSAVQSAADAVAALPDAPARAGRRPRRAGRASSGRSRACARGCPSTRPWPCTRRRWLPLAWAGPHPGPAGLPGRGGRAQGRLRPRGERLHVPRRHRPRARRGRRPARLATATLPIAVRRNIRQRVPARLRPGRRHPSRAWRSATSTPATSRRARPPFPPLAPGAERGRGRAARARRRRARGRARGRGAPPESRPERCRGAYRLGRHRPRRAPPSWPGPCCLRGTARRRHGCAWLGRGDADARLLLLVAGPARCRTRGPPLLSPDAFASALLGPLLRARSTCSSPRRGCCPGRWCSSRPSSRRPRRVPRSARCGGGRAARRAACWRGASSTGSPTPWPTPRWTSRPCRSCPAARPSSSSTSRCCSCWAPAWCC